MANKIWAKHTIKKNIMDIDIIINYFMIISWEFGLWSVFGFIIFFKIWLFKILFIIIFLNYYILKSEINIRMDSKFGI